MLFRPAQPYPSSVEPNNPRLAISGINSDGKRCSSKHSRIMGRTLSDTNRATVSLTRTSSSVKSEVMSSRSMEFNPATMFFLAARQPTRTVPWLLRKRHDTLSSPPGYRVPCAVATIIERAPPRGRLLQMIRQRNI